jgi:hypothetical protein
LATSLIFKKLPKVNNRQSGQPAEKPRDQLKLRFQRRPILFEGLSYQNAPELTKKFSPVHVLAGQFQQGDQMLSLKKIAQWPATIAQNVAQTRKPQILSNYPM